MSDIADRAEVLEALARDQGIARARAAIAGPGQPLCSDCGEDIEAERRAAIPGATRCSCCQHDHDNRQRIDLGIGGWFDPSPFNRGRR